MTNEHEELSKLSDKELFAYFNILRVPCLKTESAAEDGKRYLQIVREILIERGYKTVITSAEVENKRVKYAK